MQLFTYSIIMLICLYHNLENTLLCWYFFFACVLFTSSSLSQKLFISRIERSTVLLVPFSLNVFTGVSFCTENPHNFLYFCTKEFCLVQAYSMSCRFWNMDYDTRKKGTPKYSLCPPSIVWGYRYKYWGVSSVPVNNEHQ